MSVPDVGQSRMTSVKLRAKMVLIESTRMEQRLHMAEFDTAASALWPPAIKRSKGRFSLRKIQVRLKKPAEFKSRIKLAP